MQCYKKYRIRHTELQSQSFSQFFPFHVSLFHSLSDYIYLKRTLYSNTVLETHINAFSCSSQPWNLWNHNHSSWPERLHTQHSQKLFLFFPEVNMRQDFSLIRLKFEGTHNILPCPQLSKPCYFMFLQPYTQLSNFFLPCLILHSHLCLLKLNLQHL